MGIWTTPIFLIVLATVLTALIYWGGFREESRNQ
jgi:hypothetical protein